MRQTKKLGSAALPLLLSLGGCAHQSPEALPPKRYQRYEAYATFTEYSPLARNEEIARRALTPLTFAVGRRWLSDQGQALREQPIDLTKEKFTVYVPAGAPPRNGYGLLVYVPSQTGDAGGLFIGWAEPLNRHRMIFVRALNSGNDVKILDRRLPLALLACENIRAQYPIDPARVYVGGGSGGSKAALVTAVAFPDVFRGVLLNGGSEPIGGEEGIYLPPADLFRRFQQSKLVYVTGDSDEVALREENVSRASMRQWCVLNIETKRARRMSHELMDAASLDTALGALDRPSAVDAGKLKRCNERIRRELASKLADAEEAITSGDRNRAVAKLKEIDGHYGGLAAPEVIELHARLPAHSP